MAYRQIIPNFPDYEATIDGLIFSLNEWKYLHPAVGSSGYLQVSLYKRKIKRSCFVHRLVLETFIGPCPDGMECRHLDGNKFNNKLGNLTWGTKKQNAHDAIKLGTHPCVNQNGEANHQSKLTEREVRTIIKLCNTNKFTQKEIAQLYDVSRPCINMIMNNKIWKHIDRS